MALQQDTKKTAVLAFGRMNPPTTGHEHLIKKTHEVAKQHGGTAHVVASHKQHKTTDPLPQDKKLGYLRKIAHPDVNVSGSSTGNPGPLHAAAKLHAAGHKHLVYVGGSDQHEGMHKLLTKYNGKKSAHGHYNFKSIKSVSAGDRDGKAEGTKGMSSSKIRDHARAGRHTEFKQGLPKALHPDAKEIHGHIGGTQLESFKEAVMKKKFKPSGEKTEVITHTMPSGGKGVGVKNGSGGKGAPANTTRSGGQRFGEGKDQYMRMVNAEFEDFTGDSLDEVLSRQARIKKALILRRFKHKIQRKKAMMRKKLATQPMLKRRARRHAIKLVRKRFMGKKGENYAKLGMADKIMIDTRVATKKAIIDRIAQRLLPKVRRAELVRLRDYKKNKQAAAKKPSSNKKFTPAPAKKQVIVKYKGPAKPTVSTQQAIKTSSYAIPQNVKSESYVTEDNVIDIVDMLSMLSEKDQKALENKMNSSDIDNNILFEVFAMGLDGDGPQTAQQQGFMSLNTFIADDYNTAAALEVPDKKYKPEEAITNLALNTRNRNSTIKNYNYGPLNDNDEEYWEKVADLWDTNTKVAKESRCHNCAVFDMKPATLKKIAKVLGPDGDKIVEQANIGYCEMFAFKCAGARVCDAWVGGGPLKEEAEIYEALDKWQDTPINGVQLDRRFTRPMVTRSTMPRLTEFKATGERSDIEDPIDPKTVTHDIIDKDPKTKKKKKKKEITEVGDAYQKSQHHGKKSYDDWSNHTLAVANVSTLKRKLASIPLNKEKASEWKQQLAKWEGIKKKHAVEALEYPHGTNKAYRKDTPGQKDEDLQQTVKKVKVLGFLAKQKLKQKARQVKAKMSTPKAKTPQYAEYDMNAMFEALLGDKDVKKNQDDHVKGAVKYVKRQEYNLNRRIKRVTSKLPHNQTKTGGVQNEDAAAQQRVAQAQQGQKERLRDRHEREMENMDNSEAKAKKKEAFQKSMASLKTRQQQRKDSARARTGTGLKTSTSRVGMDKSDPKYGKGPYKKDGINP